MDKWLIVKEEHIEQATHLFEGTGIQITKEGQRHLGAALGTQTFIERYVTEKVHEWSKEVNKLAEIATSQPHAVYTALTHGLQSKWTYLTQTVPNISDLLEPLEYALHQKLLPALTGRDGITDTERESCLHFQSNLEYWALPIPPKLPMLNTVAHGE